MDEIAYTTDADGIKSPERKRPRKDSSLDKEVERNEVEREEARSGVDDRVQGELNIVTANEFWEHQTILLDPTSHH
jgi:regulator of Ty1 transposition protein 109